MMINDELVYVVLDDTDICFIEDNEEDVLRYLENAGALNTKAARDFFISGKGVRDWLDNGHVIDEISPFLDGEYSVCQYHLGYEYNPDSANYLKAVVENRCVGG